MSLGERVITIGGTVDAICAAEKIISQRLRDYMEKDMKNSNSAYNQNMVNSFSYSHNVLHSYIQLVLDLLLYSGLSLSRTRKRPICSR